jgi:hypothetical protein
MKTIGEEKFDLSARAWWLVAQVASALVLTGCASTSGHESAAKARKGTVDDVSYWAGDGVTGAPSIVIDLSEQRAYFYKGKQIVGVSQVSTGKEGNDTPIGKFQVKEKDQDHVSNLFGNYVDKQDNVIQANVAVRDDPMPPGAHLAGARMPYFMRIVGAIGLHQGYLPGVPASHGCIRLPAKMAEAFFSCAEVGTPVEIKSDGALVSGPEKPRMPREADRSNERMGKVPGERTSPRNSSGDLTRGGS